MHKYPQNQSSVGSTAQRPFGGGAWAVVCGAPRACAVQGLGGAAAVQRLRCCFRARVACAVLCWACAVRSRGSAVTTAPIPAQKAAMLRMANVSHTAAALQATAVRQTDVACPSERAQRREDDCSTKGKGPEARFARSPPAPWRLCSAPWLANGRRQAGSGMVRGRGGWGYPNR